MTQPVLRFLENVNYSTTLFFKIYFSIYYAVLHAESPEFQWSSEYLEGN